MQDDVYDAADVAAELRRRVPGIGTKKLHKLLYLCQGHHLAETGRPLFGGSIAAWDMGPVVGGLWKHEQEHGPATAGRPLTQAALNTVGFVLSRYGRLTGRDLEILTHGEPPWNAARARGAATGDRSPKITHRELIEFFAAREAADEDGALEPAPDELLAFLRGASARAGEERCPDDLDRLKERLATVTRRG
jgi:uncharacterized phage-associated protein